MITPQTVEMIEEIKDWDLSEQERTLCHKIHSAPVYQPIPVSMDDSILIRKFIRQRNLKVKRNLTDRFEMIRNSIAADKKHSIMVLDIGCNVGFFGFSIRDAREKIVDGMYYYSGIDSDLSCIEAAEALAEYRKIEDISFVNLSVFDLIPTMYRDGVHFDYCFFLSTYHHLIGEFGFKKARHVLGLLCEMCSVMFFDMGQKDEPNNADRAYWHDALPDGDHDFLVNHEVENFTNYKNVKKLGVSNVSGRTGRILYRFDSN